MIIKKKCEPKKEEKINKKAQTEIKTQSEKIDLLDLDNINFSQRNERRRGDRRRGYRRIDDRNLISRAQEEAGTIKDNAAQEGYKAGLEKAQKDIEMVKNAITDFLVAKQEVFEYIAPDILEISIDIARKIVKHEIKQEPEVVLETILDVLKNISKDESKISIKVHPQQVDLIKNSIPSIISSTGLEIKIFVSPDETIDLGSCIILTSNGVIDATVNTQIEIIKEAFKGM